MHDTRSIPWVNPLIGLVIGWVVLGVFSPNASAQMQTIQSDAGPLAALVLALAYSAACLIFGTFVSTVCVARSGARSSDV
jgi:hypothetical protein